jgi:hypothetical protein
MILTPDEQRRADLAMIGLRNMRDWCLRNGQHSEAANFLTGVINALENGTSHPFLEDWKRRRDAREACEGAQPHRDE